MDMRRRFALGALTAGAALLWPLAGRALSLGATAPGFDLPGTSGQVRLADLRGKVVLVDFWASWCAPCKLSFPWMNDMQQRYGKAGLQVVAINVDTKRADADRFLAAQPVSIAIAFDAGGATPRAYGVKAMPTSYLVAPDGRVLHVHAGFREEDKPAMEDRIRKALARS